MSSSRSSECPCNVKRLTTRRRKPLNLCLFDMFIRKFKLCRCQHCFSCISLPCSSPAQQSPDKRMLTVELQAEPSAVSSHYADVCRRQARHCDSTNYAACRCHRQPLSRHACTFFRAAAPPAMFLKSAKIELAAHVIFYARFYVILASFCKSPTVKLMLVLLFSC